MAKEMIVIEGGTPLSGEVQVSGAKNSALKLIAASILGQGETTLYNVPIISDIAVMSKVLEGLGGRVTREGHTLTVDTKGVDMWEAPYEFVSKMRASIAVLGPLVARFGRARVAMPGGCNLGARKIDIHIVGMHALGVNFETDHGYINASAPNGLHGAYVALDFPSVGATENAMMCAVVAKGETVIENAAREPEIEDLADMLNAMGAKVSGAGTSTIIVEGVALADLHPCEHTTVGDRIEAGTFLVGGAMMGGPVTVRGIEPGFLRMALMKLSAMGCSTKIGEDWITVSRKGSLHAIDIQTLPHPGFPTDLQAQFMLLGSVAEGNSVITENVFENRFMFADEIGRMGAQITIEGHHAIVEGTSGLQGTDVRATDLRCGASLVLAGIHAEGTTRVHEIHHIDRGYEDYVGKLLSLGANIRRESEEEQDW